MCRSALRLIGVANLALLLIPAPVQACATCFGRSDSKLAEGLNMGILSLLVVVLCVLGGFGAFFIFLWRRASRMAKTGGAAAVAEVPAAGLLPPEPLNSRLSSPSALLGQRVVLGPNVVHHCQDRKSGERGR